jgi:hypothetical protein
MDFSTYLERPDENAKDYYHRLWMSDLWDKVSTNQYDVPNQLIRTIVNMKRYVYGLTREQLVRLSNHFEADLSSNAIDTMHYEWVKMYYRRIQRRKNMAFQPLLKKTFTPKSRRHSTVGFKPSSLSKGIAFKTDMRDERI